MKGNRTVELETKELVKQREKLYGKIKENLKPLILKLIKDAEKVKGHMRYWDLYNKLMATLGLAISDYERIIQELEEEVLIKKGWSAGIGGFLTTN